LDFSNKSLKVLITRSSFKDHATKIKEREITIVEVSDVANHLPSIIIDLVVKKKLAFGRVNSLT
jgi:hypothetical protein